MNRKARKYRTIRRIILGTLVAVVLLVGAALLALQTEPAKAYVLDELTSRINERLAGEVEAERVSGTLLFGATLHDVELHDARGGEVLVVDEAALNYSIFSLLGGALDIDGVELERPEMTVRRYDDGTLNVSLIAQPRQHNSSTASDAEPIYYDIPRVRIAGGTLHYEELTATDVDADGRLRLSSHGHYEGSVDAVDLQTDAGPLEEVARVEADTVTFEGDRTRLALSATDITFAEGVNVARFEMSRELPEDGQGEPVPVSGRVEELEVTTRFAKGLAPSLELASPINVEGRFDGVVDDLEVNAVARSAEGGRIDVQGTVDATQSAFDLDVRSEDFDLADWVVRDGEPVRASAQGAVSGRRTDDGLLRANVKMDLTDASFGGHRAAEVFIGPREPLVVRLEGAGAFAARGDVDLRGYQGRGVEMARLDTTVDLRRTPSAITGTVRADLDDLVTGERTFGDGRVTLALGEGRAFDLGINAVPNVRPRIPLTLSTSGVHGAEFDLFDLASLEVGSPGLTWSTRDDSTVRLTDEQVVINSLVLEGPTSPIRLDGTYPRDNVWGTILERLGRAGLDELMRGGNLAERVREQLPESLGDLTPDEVEDAVPDEVEDRVRDEVRRRLRLPEF